MAVETVGFLIALQIAKIGFVAAPLLTITGSVVLRLAPAAGMTQTMAVTARNADRVAGVIFPMADHAGGIVCRWELEGKPLRMLGDLLPAIGVVTITAGRAGLPLQMLAVALLTIQKADLYHAGAVNVDLAPVVGVGKNSFGTGIRFCGERGVGGTVSRCSIPLVGGGLF